MDKSCDYTVWDLRVGLTLTVFLFASTVASGTPPSPSSCHGSSCYPVTGDLLLGRARRLFSSSTCGLQQPTPYCILGHLEETNNCFVCDSRQPYGIWNRDSHRVENVVSDFGTDWKEKWWQGENGLSSIHLQVDLEAEFLLTHLILKFKTFRPAAMFIERSADFGKTWEVYRYFAHDCEKSFPGVSVGSVTRIGDVICESRYSDIAPSTEGEVIFRVLPATVSISDPYAKEVQDLLRITNLRVNFTALHTLGDNLIGTAADSNVNYYYALYSFVLRGSCSCYGHASHCIPSPGQENIPDMIHGNCECVHNTKGSNCERCDDFYNDLPWQPARRETANACRKCKCNDHAWSCHFDPAVYEASGRVSGGVCDDCLHNTDGIHCHLCRPFFFQDPHLQLKDPDICKPCDCDPYGSLHGGECDGHTDQALDMVAGRCTCKRFVTGTRCEFCAAGFWNLDDANADGCQACTCNTLGTVGASTSCDQQTGQCRCKRFVTGIECDRCLEGYWRFGFGADGCVPCDCDVGGALGDSCGPVDGQCRCRPNVIGINCNKPATGFFFPRLDHLFYEAELARASGRTVIDLRTREEGVDVTWTGLGFRKAFEGDTIEFVIKDIPSTLSYSAVVRYEKQRIKSLDNIKLTLVRPFPVDPNGPCRGTRPKYDTKQVVFSHGNRYFMTSTNFCLESGKSYRLRLHWKSNQHVINDSSILIDSIVLFPDVTSIPVFQDTPKGRAALQDFLQLRCSGFHLPAVQPVASDRCVQLANSMSAVVYNGAIACDCHPIGSRSESCKPIGGQCSCKANVIGRRCDQCVPGSHSFGRFGCLECDCDALGSRDNACDVTTGRCSCQGNVIGGKCASCARGSYKFPECLPCTCNGHADDCDATTGRCIGCTDNTVGHNCERCSEGHAGDPRSASGCHPCLCPGEPGSGVHHADSCQMDPDSLEITCNCHYGYRGKRCDMCEVNHFGHPLAPGGTCRRCNCNENIDFDVADSCDAETGRCTKCLYNTEGFSCERCQLGYYGDAVKQHLCKKCSCSTLGTNRTNPYCDRVTGQCPCLPNVTGRKCDKCRSLHWKLASGYGCEPCDCDPSGSLYLECNEFDGQCDCVGGREGRDCSLCPDYHWKSPRLEGPCSPCDCDLIGSIDSSCDHVTGQCHCVEGVTGRTCDKCAPKTSGTVPDCHPCGECLERWESVLQKLRLESKTVMMEASVGDGIPQELRDNMERVEDMLDEYKRLTASGPKEVENLDNDTLEYLLQLKSSFLSSAVHLNVTDIRLENLTGRLERVFARMELIDHRNITAKQKHLREYATRIKELDTSGAYESITGSRFRSVDAHNRLETAKNWVIDAEIFRNQVNDVVNEFQPSYILQMNETEAPLRHIQDALNELSPNIKNFHSLVCGVYGTSCNVTCIGGSDGCGDCSGKEVACHERAMTFSSSAHRLAQEASALLSNKRMLADDISSQVNDLKEDGDLALFHSEAAFSRAVESKNRLERQKEDLLELFANQSAFTAKQGAASNATQKSIDDALQLEIHVAPEAVRSLARKVNRTLRGLKNVDRILKQTRDEVNQGKQVRQRADDVQEKAEAARNAALVAAEDLNLAAALQNSASASIKEEMDEVKALGHDSERIEYQITAFHNVTGLEERLKNATDRLDSLKSRREDIKRRVDLAETVTKNVSEMLARLNASSAEVEGKEKRIRRRLDRKYQQAVIAKARTEQLRRRTSAMQQLLTNANNLESVLSSLEAGLPDALSQIDRLQSEMSDLLTAVKQKFRYLMHGCVW